MESNRTVNLRSSNNKLFKLSEKAASRSKLIKDMINDYEDEVDFPLPEVRTEALEKIVEYLKHYENSEPKEIPRPLQDSQINKILDEWDFNFINSISKEEAINLINAANYMDISSLLHLTACKIASWMLDKDVETVRKEFGIVNDMTEEEQKEYDKFKIE